MNLEPPVRPGHVLVLGEYPATVAVVRSLGRAGFEVTLGTAEARSSAGLSRFVSDVWVYDNATAQRFCNHVEAFLRNERPDFVFPVGGAELRRLSEAGPRLEPLSTWVNPDFATVARCFDKRAMDELAASLGIPVLAAGERHDCHVAAADGRLLACIHESGPSAALRAYCEALVKALRYTGIGCIAFRVEERSGRAAFLEFDVMGRAFPLLALQLAAYRQARAAGRANAERLLPGPIAAGKASGKTWPWLRDPLPALHMLWRKYLSRPLPH